MLKRIHKKHVQSQLFHNDSLDGSYSRIYTLYLVIYYSSVFSRSSVFL